SLLLTQTPISTHFPYTTLFRSGMLRNARLSSLRERAYPAAPSHALEPNSHVIRFSQGSGRVSRQGVGRQSRRRRGRRDCRRADRSEEHTSELQSRENLVCRLLL